MTQASKISYRPTNRAAFTVKPGETIARGALVGIDAGGLAVEATADNALTIVGVASNSTTTLVEVERYGAYAMENDYTDLAAPACLFKDVYVSGANKVAASDGGGTRPVAGRLHSIEGAVAYIKFK